MPESMRLPTSSWLSTSGKRVGLLGYGVSPTLKFASERLVEHKTQSRKVLCDGVAVELPVGKQVRPILSYLLRS